MVLRRGESGGGRWKVKELLSMGCGQKNLYASVAVPPAPVGFLENGHLPQVSRQSRLSANDEDEQ